MNFRKVHCFFEQSGTFKNEFKKLGISAEDYDIQNNFGETDHVIDIFENIEKAYNGEKSIFDEIECDDLIMAFFPCIYFSSIQMCFYSLESVTNKNKSVCEKIDEALERLEKRTKFHALLYKLLFICMKKNIKLVVENPFSTLGYLTGIQNFPKPAIVDMNRRRHGDYFEKPTAFWFFNFVPTNGNTIQWCKEKDFKVVQNCKSGIKAGICSEERSMISADYARNFICVKILGKKQEIGQCSLF
jgi:hypothetical protein